MRAHFAGRDRFIEFDIERDAPERLRDFLAPTYRIDPAHWAKANSTDWHRRTRVFKKVKGLLQRGGAAHS